jgi:hypothetical protein
MGSWAERVLWGATAAAFPYLITLVVVTGCEQTPAGPAKCAPPADGDLIVLIGPDQSDPRWAGIAGGAQRFIERYPSLRLHTVAPPDNSRARLLEAVRDALSEEPRVICLYISYPARARAAIDQILHHGIPLITMGVRSDNPQVFGHVQVNLAGGAQLLGENLVEIAAGKRSYLLLHWQDASAEDGHCYTRFMAMTRSHGGLTLLEQRDASTAKQTPAELLREMFTRFRHAGLAVTLHPAPWLSAPPAQLLGRDARFATLGAAPALWPYLRSGEAAALVGSIDGEVGSLAVEIAIIAMTDSRQAGLVRVVESELVTRETLGDFANRYAEAAGLDSHELLASPATSRPAPPASRPPQP